MTLSHDHSALGSTETTAVCVVVVRFLRSLDRLTRVVRQDLFGKTCAGMRLLYERGVVKHRSQSELDEMRQKGGRTWYEILTEI